MAPSSSPSAAANRWSRDPSGGERGFYYGKRLPNPRRHATTDVVTSPTPRSPGRAGLQNVTLHDVAREAGVAVSTVSRALTQPDRISPATRARVQEVARRLGYRPNRIARAVVSGRTQMLAVLVPDITNPHHFGLIRGAEERARAADRTLVLGDTRGDPGLEADHLDRLGSVVDGIVLASSRLPDASTIPSTTEP